jgi:hypothetical protein
VLPAGATLNPADGAMIALDSIWNGVFTFLRRELFKRPSLPQHL